MPDAQARIEALRWAASFCGIEACVGEELADRHGGDTRTVAAIWRSRADTFRTMADELEREAKP